MLRRLLVVALVGLAGSAVVAAVVFATGRAAFVVAHGVSMNPIYHHGDLVVVARAPSYRVGQIAAYRIQREGVVVLHRIIDGDAAGFVFKGDNNQSTDPYKPTADQIVGRPVLLVPRAGLGFHVVTSPVTLGLLAFVLVAGGGAAAARTRRQRHRARHREEASVMPNTGTSAPRRPPSSISMAAITVRSSPRLRATAGVIVVAVALGVLLGILAFAGPARVPAGTERQSAGQMVFAYSAEVGRTAAYDATTVRSPDPVFRRLAQEVAVRLGYQGDPGQMAVDLELSADSGWHHTFPLTEATEFTGHRHDETVLLDLDALDKRAADAADVIGIPASHVYVTVVARVTTTAGRLFEPALKFSLTTPRLSLLGGPETLVVKDRQAAAGGGPLTPRTLRLFGHPVMSVVTARLLSGLLLLGGLAAAGAFALAVRRAGPVSEDTRIGLRYKSLLVRVEPMPAPAGRPVVEVPDFETLVRLAERYGLLIMHWTRSRSETYIVQDEGTTYRYRTEERGPEGAGEEPASDGPEGGAEPPPSGTAIFGLGVSDPDKT